MQNPREEIVDVVKSATAANKVSEQRNTILHYFAPDAGLQHPLCTVERGEGSREQILGLFQWFRDLSPKLDLTIERFTYDPDQQVIYLNIVQTVHVWCSPFSGKPSRLLVRLDLERSQEDGKLYIAQQTDYFQPEDVMQMTIPFLSAPTAFAKRITATVFCYNAWLYGWVRAQIHPWARMVSSSIQAQKSELNGDAQENNKED